MLKRIFPPATLQTLEASLVCLFFIQALRFAIGIYYSRVAGASAYAILPDPSLIPAGTLGVVTPGMVSGEISLLIYLLALPLLALIFGRARPMLLVAAVIVAASRALINLMPDSAAVASAAVVGGGLLYIALLIRQRANQLPFAMTFALGADQLLRAAGDTLDPSWSAGYAGVQIGLTALVILLAMMGLRRPTPRPDGDVQAEHGTLPFWGAVGLGGLLYLQLALLTMPNAIAGRSGYEYTPLVPLTLAATLAPLIPWVRARARDVITLFDPSVRGWVWLLLIALLIILGTRLSGVIAGGALVIAQLLASLLWWWVARPAAEKERNLTSLWMFIAVAIFGLLLAGDFFTYEYAYVQNFSGNLTFLNPFIPPLLRGFRGLGLGVLLLAIFFAALPMTQTLRRIPWITGGNRYALGTLLLVIAAAVGGALLARPPVVSAQRIEDSFRVGTFNIHNGSNEFFYSDLPAIAQTIQVSGANVVLLQEVEAGRLTSFGVDQALWLARRLGMDRRFYPTNEGLHGLAVLSKIPISLADGALLPSQYQQTGVQRVQILPTPDTVVTIYNTWLGVLTASDDEALAAQEQDQQIQLTALSTLVRAQHPNGVLGRTIIGGTFHNVPDSPLAQELRAAGFDDPFAGLPIQLSATLVRTGLPQVRFDYLWLRNLGRLEAGIVSLPDAQASDHRMAVALVALGG
jgi:endonuclease/exonuclease/phosphatase family metal-dependent hydrolase